MKKYLVIYKLPSGVWSTGFKTDDKTKAYDYAESEQKRTGFVHLVYKLDGEA